MTYSEITSIVLNKGFKLGLCNNGHDSYKEIHYICDKDILCLEGHDYPKTNSGRIDIKFYSVDGALNNFLRISYTGLDNACINSTITFFQGYCKSKEILEFLLEDVENPNLYFFCKRN